jgi:hypothetical protein
MKEEIQQLKEKAGEEFDNKITSYDTEILEFLETLKKR